MWYVYICDRRGQPYTGITTDLGRRMSKHGASLLDAEHFQDKHAAGAGIVTPSWGKSRSRNVWTNCRHQARLSACDFARYASGKPPRCQCRLTAFAPTSARPNPVRGTTSSRPASDSEDWRSRLGVALPMTTMKFEQRVFDFQGSPYGPLGPRH